MPPKRKHTKAHKKHKSTKRHHKGRGYQNDKLRGEGFWDGLVSGLSAIPGAFNQIVPGIIGAVNNSNEIDKGIDRVVNFGQSVGKLVPILKPLLGKGQNQRMQQGGMNLQSQFLPDQGAIQVGLNKIVV